MRSVKFWKMEIQRLSVAERQFFSGAIETLFAWKLLKEEYAELDLIRRILESETGHTEFPQHKKEQKPASLFINHRLPSKGH